MADEKPGKNLITFFSYLPPQIDSIPLLEKVKLAAFYAICITGFVGGGINLFMTFSPDNMNSFIAVLIFDTLLLVALITFLQSRQLNKARTFLAMAVIILMSQTIIDAGGAFGFGIYYFLAGIPLLYFVFSLPAGTAIALFLFFGTALRLWVGNFSPGSIYNNPDHISRTLMVLGTGTSLGIVVNFCLDYFVRQLSSLAFNDQVTKLPNRHRLQTFLNDAVISGLKDGTEFSLLGIRLINYDKVNANLGSVQADKVLMQLGERLASVLTDTKVAGRWSGALFIAISSQTAPDVLGALGKEIHAVLSAPFESGTKRVYLQSTAAVCRYPVDGANSEELMRNLVSLLDSRQGLDGRMIFFNESIHRREEFRFNLLEALNHADVEKEFTVVFQPKIRFSDQTCCGAEVLCRWNHPMLGLVSPGDFIPLAEEGGFIRSITRHVINQTFHYMDSPEWRNLPGNSGLVHAINLSVMDLKDRGFLGFLRESLQKYHTDPLNVEFELTEGILVDEDYQIQHTLRAVMDLGFKIAIDDFGTGYSSLSYLHRMKVHNLKIDQSFVSIIDPRCSPETTWPVVDAIISMGQSLGLEITAEGVETPEQAEYLKARGCTTAQGWLYSRGVDFHEYLDFLKTGEMARTGSTQQPGS